MQACKYTRIQDEKLDLNGLYFTPNIKAMGKCDNLMIFPPLTELKMAIEMGNINDG